MGGIALEHRLIWNLKATPGTATNTPTLTLHFDLDPPKQQDFTLLLLLL